jgi:hypothetical protein
MKGLDMEKQRENDIRLANDLHMISMFEDEYLEYLEREKNKDISNVQKDKV